MIGTARLKALVLLCSLLPFPLLSPAAPRDYAGKNIAAIEFEPPQQPYPAAELEKLVGIRPESPLDLTLVRGALDKLMATGRYADIVVDAQDGPAGVTLRFITRMNYFLGRVTAEGVSEPPSQGVLINTTKLELGSLFVPEQVAQAKTHLQTVLRNNGFFQSGIETRYEYDPRTQQVQIHFEIDPGERARYSWPSFTGDTRIPPERLLKATHWKRIWFLGWREVTEGRTMGGLARIRRSYRKGDRFMAQVNLNDIGYKPDTNRVQPSINVQAGPRVEIRTEGAKVSRGKLRQMVPVYEEQSVDRDLLVEGARNLKEYFESKGYFDAQVDFATSGTPDQQEIVYSIDRGEPHKVVLVSILGNKYFDTPTIRERMYVRPVTFLQFPSGRYSDNLLRRDVAAIEELYRNNGFRDVEVHTRTEHGYDGVPNHMAVFITIVENQQWLVGQLDVTGVSEAHREEVMGSLQSLVGQPFSDEIVAFDRENVLEYYYNAGYPEATFQWSFHPAQTPNRVELTYTIAEGERRFVREVLVSGLHTTNPDLVNERITLEAGEPLSRAKMLDTQRRLYNLGIFAKVDMALQDPQGEERSKYVLIQAEESRRYTVTGGLGAEIAKIGGSTTLPSDPAGTTGFSPRVYLDVTRRNMFGEGHLASIRGRLSTLQKRAVFSYVAPQFRGSANFDLTFSLTYDDSRDVRTFTSKRQEAAIQVGEKLSRASTLLYRFAYRRVEVSNLKIDPLLFPQFAQSVRLGIAGVSYIQDRRDDPADATRGVYNTVDASWASQYFGGQANFTHFLVRNATYHPFGAGRRFVLARSFTFGWLQSLKAGQDVPLAERFFAGGAASHRGFPENQAGPRDLKTGFPLGGDALLLNQIEWRFPLIGDNLRGVLFHDMGNVYSSVKDITLRYQQHGDKDFNYNVNAVGFGVRYRTPVGPLRLDLAYVPNSPKFFGLKGTTEDFIEGKGVPTLQRISRFQFHFSLGQAF